MNKWSLPKVSRRHTTIPVYIHFEFDDYEGDRMILEEKNKYIAWRMVPPGSWRYFISVNLLQTSIIYN